MFRRLQSLEIPKQGPHRQRRPGRKEILTGLPLKTGPRLMVWAREAQMWTGHVGQTELDTGCRVTDSSPFILSLQAWPAKGRSGQQIPQYLGCYHCALKKMKARASSQGVRGFSAGVERLGISASWEQSHQAAWDRGWSPTEGPSLPSTAWLGVKTQHCSDTTPDIFPQPAL
jgi:hypothetical protein